MAISVVYVDDEAPLCDMVSAYFDGEGIDLHAFTDPEAAIAFVEQSPADIAFIDYRLSDVRGDEVAAAMLDTIPKVLITGDLLVKPTFEFDAVLAKPFDFIELQQLIDRLC